MQEQNQKILGAFVVGFALIGGTYTLVNFGEPRLEKASVIEGEAATRNPIAVTDNDGNGIEDWRDAFLDETPIVIAPATTTYTPPTTVTGQMGVQFFEDILLAKNYGPFGRTQEQIVQDTVENLAQNATQTLYGLGDADVMDTWTDEDIRLYGNTMGTIILNNEKNLGDEVTILYDVLTYNKTDRLQELQSLSTAYRSMRDSTLSTPVPKPFLKEHLDLVNTYEALYQNVEAMTKSLEDPAVTLIRIRRYEDDALGLTLALENMYRSLVPYSNLFGVNDAATVFNGFNPETLTQ